jgi:hypothetical protein
LRICYEIENTPQGKEEQAPKMSGFEAISAIGLMMAGYMIRRRLNPAL